MINLAQRLLCRKYGGTMPFRIKSKAQRDLEREIRRFTNRLKYHAKKNKVVVVAAVKEEKVYLNNKQIEEDISMKEDFYRALEKE